MSYTVEQLISGSLRLIGAMSSADSMTATEKTNNLAAVNLMLDSWWMDMYLEAHKEESHTLVDGTEVYTIGSGGDINTVRPIRIEHAWIRDSNSNEYPVYVHMTEQEYNSKIDRQTAEARPTDLFYDPQFTLGKIYLWPTPDAAETLYIRSRKPFTEFAAITETVTVEAAVKRAIKFNAAIELAPEYNRSVSPEVAKIAAESYETLKNLHPRPKVATTELTRGYRANILAG